MGPNGRLKPGPRLRRPCATLEHHAASDEGSADDFGRHAVITASGTDIVRQTEILAAVLGVSNASIVEKGAYQSERLYVLS